MKHVHLGQMDNSSGGFFGHYQIIEQIGKGGFADVYLARHIHLGMLVAIKVLRTNFEAQESQKLKEEARLLAKLDHPHIVHVIDYGIANGSPYLVMQLAENGSLRDVYPISSVLPLPLVLNYTQQVGSALTYLHKHQLVHQDIKPENMLLQAHDQILLSDFGLAVLIRKMMTRQPEGFACTLAYTAPERFQPHYTPDPASDQYALSAVIYELLAGRCPFEGTSEQVFYGHLQLQPPSLRQFNPSVPASVEQVILRALAKDPRQRFESIAAFVSAFEFACQQRQDRLNDTLPVDPKSALEGFKGSRETKKAVLPIADGNSNRYHQKLYGVGSLLLFEILFSVIPGIIALALGIDSEKVCLLFCISVLLLPVVGVLLVWRNTYVRSLVFVTLLLSIVSAILTHDFLISAIVQLALMSFSASIVFALRRFRVRDK